MASQQPTSMNSRSVIVEQGSMNERDPGNSNSALHLSQTLEFPYIISFLHSRDLTVDEIKLQALDVETVVDSLNYTITRVLKVCPEKDLDAITSKQIVSVGAAFRAKLVVIQSGLRQIGFSDKFGLAEVGRLCPPEKNDRTDKPEKADILWIRSLFTRLINYHEYLESFKTYIAPAITQVELLQSQLLDADKAKADKIAALQQLLFRQADERPLVERLSKEVQDYKAELVTEGQLLQQAEESHRIAAHSLQNVTRDLARLKQIELDIQTKIEDTTLKITKSPAKIQAERERIQSTLIEAEAEYNNEFQLVKQLEDKCAKIVSQKKEFSQRVGDMGRLQASLLENNVLEDRAAEINRTLAALKQNYEHLADTVHNLKSQAEESERVYNQLGHDLEDLEKKTATIIRIEGLSVEEKEQTQHKLLHDISEAQKAKEKLMALLNSRTNEMNSMHQIHMSVSERISKLQHRYKTAFNQLVQQLSNDVAVRDSNVAGKGFQPNFT